MWDLVWPWLKAFAFTELIEVPIYRKLGPTRWRTAVLASAITHPFVWFVFPWLGLTLELSWTLSATLSEIFAWLVEMLFVKWMSTSSSTSSSARQAAPAGPTSWPRAGLLSFAANGASLGLGLLVRELTGWI